MHRRANNSTMRTDTVITELPEVRQHLAYLEAQHRDRLAGTQPPVRKPPSAPAKKDQLTITIPLSAEIIQAVKAAEAEAALFASKQEKSARRRRVNT